MVCNLYIVVQIVTNLFHFRIPESRSRQFARLFKVIPKTFHNQNIGQAYFYYIIITYKIECLRAIFGTYYHHIYFLQYFESR